MKKYEKYRQTTYDNYVLFSRPINTKKKWAYETEASDFEDLQEEIFFIIYDQTPDDLPLEFKVVEIPAANSLKPYSSKEMLVKPTLQKAICYLSDKGII